MESEIIQHDTVQYSIIWSILNEIYYIMIEYSITFYDVIQYNTICYDIIKYVLI